MIIFIVLYLFLLVLEANAQDEGASRTKRQLSIGFGLPNGGDATIGIGGAINSFLGGLFGGNQNPNQIINPIDVFNQFGGGFIQGNCNDNNGGCQHGCRAIRNRAQCYCNQGYFLNQDGKTCHDIDECSDPFNRPCQDICHNADGSFKCSCSDGMTLLPDGRSCGRHEATISCSANNGGCQQICAETPFGIACSCVGGFLLNLDHATCVDVDECASGQHNCGPLPCQNTPGSFQCQQGPGPSTLSNCSVNNGGCSHICRQNRRRGARCSCPQGFTLQSDQKICLSAQTPNPCLVNNGGCQQKCTNQQGKVHCSCEAGFVLTNNQACQLADPCSVKNGGCQHQCVNNQGVPQCQCQAGFLLVNGKLCQQPTVPTVIPPVGTTSPNPQQLKGCGSNSKKSLFRRIVGGKPADPKDWPWMAALLRATGIRQFCGGTLITERHVLSAAHCVHMFTANDIVIRLGEYNFDTPNENSPSDFGVAEIRKHENYDSVNQENDIALLKLNRPATFSEFIWPACLPPPNNGFEDQLGYVTGWGTIHFGGPVSNVLQEVVVPVWKQSDCAAAYPNNLVADSMMCAGERTGGKDSCQGDSGGPFLTQIFPDQRWYVAGIVSWGIECAGPNRPGVYTRVNKYLPWIQQNTAV